MLLLLELAGVLVQHLICRGLAVIVVGEFAAIRLPSLILLFKHGIGQLLLHQEGLFRADHRLSIVNQLIVLHIGNSTGIHCFIVSRRHRFVINILNHVLFYVVVRSLAAVDSTGEGGRLLRLLWNLTNWLILLFILQCKAIGVHLHLCLDHAFIFCHWLLFLLMDLLLVGLHAW